MLLPYREFVMTTDNTNITVTLPLPNSRQSAPVPSASPHSQSSDMSPLTAILSLMVLIAVPALLYAFFFAINCPRIPVGRPRRRSQDVDSINNEEIKQIELVSSSVKYKKEADYEEKYGSECPVCLSVFVEGDLLRQLSACKHSFHVACIDKWLCSHSNCPVCRASVRTLTFTGRSKQLAQRGEEDSRQGLPDAASLV